MQQTTTLPSALDNFQKIIEKFIGKKPAIFLDYDGTLAPIVNNPSKAYMPEDMRIAVDQLSQVCTVAIVSGRHRNDVENFVQLNHLIYAGSHGFDISGPGINMQLPEAEDKLPSLRKATEEIKEKVKAIKGCEVEPKKYAVAVHYRNVLDEDVQKVKNAVNQVLQNHQNLKKGAGKKVLEIKPDLDWHKGKAVIWLMEALQLNESSFPIYIGDDITDEDAFRELKEDNGIGILVGSHGEETAATFSLEDLDQVKQYLEMLYSFYNKS